MPQAPSGWQPSSWGVVVDTFHLDRWDYLRGVLCLVGVAVILYAPGMQSANDT
jgi:drug/metabolite transporter superfamily protein YnfA